MCHKRFSSRLQKCQSHYNSALKEGVRELELEQPLQSALEHWKEQLYMSEFYFLADTLELQSQTGGNLVSVCNRLAILLEEREKLERDIRSFTAQGKMSGLLIALLWPLSLWLFAWLSPSHTEILFSTVPGQTLLAISFIA